MKGLYANIHAKRKRIAAGSGEKMRKPGTKGAPTAEGVSKSQQRPPRRPRRSEDEVRIMNLADLKVTLPGPAEQV